MKKTPESGNNNMNIIGNKESFAFVLGKKTEEDIQQIDIWVSGELLTFVDNSAYLPQFISSLESELDDLKNGNVDSDYVFLNLGPTLDDVSARIEINGEQVFLKCHLYKGDGKIISLRINRDELIECYEACINSTKN